MSSFKTPKWMQKLRDKEDANRKPIERKSATKVIYAKSQVEVKIEEPTLKIIDVSSPNVFGIVLFKQQSLNEIFKNSGENAIDNEFQVHYTALTKRIILDGQVLFVNIPIMFYNYKQTVSSSSISFNYGDVQEISEQLEPLAQVQAEEILQGDSLEKIDEMLASVLGTSGEEAWYITSMHTMHRHPGQLDSFSTTDYQKNADNPGIVFPILSCEKNTPSFSSIICAGNNTMKLVHTECRNVNSTEKEVKYQHGSCVSLISGIEVKSTLLEIAFGRDRDLSIDSYSIKDKASKDFFDESIFDILDSIDVSTEFITSENVTKESYGYSYRDRYQSKFNSPSMYGYNSTKDDDSYFDEEYDKEKYGNYEKNLNEDIKKQESLEELADALEESNLNTIESNAKLYRLEFDTDLLTGYINIDTDSKDFDEDGMRFVLMSELVTCGESATELISLDAKEILKMSKDMGIIVEIPEKYISEEKNIDKE